MKIRKFNESVNNEIEDLFIELIDIGFVMNLTTGYSSTEDNFRESSDNNHTKPATRVTLNLDRKSETELKNINEIIEILDEINNRSSDDYKMILRNLHFTYNHSMIDYIMIPLDSKPIKVNEDENFYFFLTTIKTKFRRTTSIYISYDITNTEDTIIFTPKDIDFKYKVIYSKFKAFFNNSFLDNRYYMANIGATQYFLYEIKILPDCIHIKYNGTANRR